MKDRFYVILLISFIVHGLFILFIELQPKNQKGNKQTQGLLSTTYRHGTIIKSKQKSKKTKHSDEQKSKINKKTTKKEDSQQKEKKIDLFPNDVINGIAKEQNSGNRGTEIAEIGSNSSLRDGQSSLLDTVEFKYVSYFNNMIKCIYENWFPLDLVYKYDPTGEKYFFKNRKTILFVILDEQGYIVQMSIFESSGVEFLDQEAINAFKRCGQFPNPPKGLIKDNKVEFNFGFKVYFNK